MQASTLTRTLLVSVAFVFAGAAKAQSADKEATTATKQGTAKSSTKAATPKRLDFVPANAVKQTTTRPTGATPALPAKQDWHCDHSQASDA